MKISLSLKVTIKAQLDANQPGVQSILDLLKQMFPSLAALEGIFSDYTFNLNPFPSGKIDPIGALVKLLKKALKELADPAKLQQAVADMKADPSKLADLAMKIKGESYEIIGF